MSDVILGGPAFEPGRHDGFKKVIDQDPRGAHYSIWFIDVGPDGRVDHDVGMQSLKSMFPDAQADGENFVLFSTSGIHGSYRTIEEIEASVVKWGDEDRTPDWEDEHEAEGYVNPTLTILIVQPRIVCLRCGNVRVKAADIPYLKALRATSISSIQHEG